MHAGACGRVSPCALFEPMPDSFGHSSRSLKRHDLRCIPSNRLGRSSRSPMPDAQLQWPCQRLTRGRILRVPAHPLMGSKLCDHFFLRDLKFRCKLSHNKMRATSSWQAYAHVPYEFRQQCVTNFWSDEEALLHTDSFPYCLAD